MKFPDILKSLRKKENLNQLELAKAIGVSRSAIGMYESGLREPDFETMEAIADYFNVSMDYLHGKSEQQKTPAANSDETLMFALYGGDNKDITPGMLEDVRKFAQFIREKEKEKEDGK